MTAVRRGTARTCGRITISTATCAGRPSTSRNPRRRRCRRSTFPPVSRPSASRWSSAASANAAAAAARAAPEPNPFPGDVSSMSSSTETIETFVKQGYAYGFVTDIETESAPPGLNEDIIRFITERKKEPDWLLDWRLKAYRHWKTLREPTWQYPRFKPIDYDAIVYYSAPRQKKDGPRSLDEVDPRLLET